MKCIVLKFGTGVLAETGGCALDTKQICRIAAEVSSLRKQGIPCIIVSSAAIAAGVHALGLEKRPTDQEGKQAAAAVGQPALINAYSKYFSQHGMTAAQLLLTHEDIFTEKRRHNAQATLRHLLAFPTVIPIINENDSVAVEELRLGDNDELSAQVAVMMKARFLMILTTSEGLMATAGNISPVRIPHVTNVQDVWHHVTQEKGAQSTGGMVTKLKAVEVATLAGIETVIADGRKENQIQKALLGEDIGTRFLSRTIG